MLFSYAPIRNKLLSTMLYGFSVCFVATSAYAAHLTQPLSVNEIKQLIRPSFASTMHITAEPELMTKLNTILTSEKDYNQMQAAFERMQNYKNTIQGELVHRHIPYDLFAMPIVQSGFRPLPESANPMKAAGIWQIIPSTAENLGLTMTANKDERLNTTLSTKAALDYLQTLYKEFKDWKLAVVAYELGEDKTRELIQKTGSKNAWLIARSSSISKNKQKYLLDYLAYFDATVIILHNETLVR